jgi:hypothetical protein
MRDDNWVQIRAVPLLDEVVQARVRQRQIDAENEAPIRARVDAHLKTAETVLDVLRDQHQSLLEETDFAPLQKTRPGAAWLLAGRCLSLGYAVVSSLCAGLTTDVAPLVRTLHEASGALRILLDNHESDLHRRWLKNGYFKVKDLQQAQKRIEDRAAVEMLKQGIQPPDRTDELDHDLYDQWSRIAHNRRSSILESYDSSLREFAYGAHTDPLRRGVWVGYGTQVVYEVTVTVGLALSKFNGLKVWAARVEPAISALDRVQRECPLDPDALGFEQCQDRRTDAATPMD